MKRFCFFPPQRQTMAEQFLRQQVILFIPSNNPPTQGKFRQIRISFFPRFHGSNNLLMGASLCQQGACQSPVLASLTPHILEFALNGLACILFRFYKISQTVIAIHVVQRIVIRFPLFLLLLAQEFEIALQLFFDHMQRISGMENHKLRRCKYLVFRCTPVNDMLMNFSLIAQIATVPENAQLIYRAREAIALILVDIHKTADDPKDALILPLHLRQKRTHLIDGLWTEVFIGIEKENPVPRCLSERIILRRREIVPPFPTKNPGACRLSQCDSLIFRSGIDNDHLIGNFFHRLQPDADIFFFILCNHAGGELHAPTSFNHVS